MSITDTGLTAEVEVERAEDAFLTADSAATAEDIAQAPAETGALDTTYDRSFGLDKPDVGEDENDYSHGYGPPPEIVEAAATFGASEQEDYELGDPR